MRNKNPFEYDGANNLQEEDIISFYIEDYNFSRTINSTRNIFIIGERGSGKTMALLYNSFKIQYRKSQKTNTKISFERIGVYVPCNTPLFHKKEYEFLTNEPFKASIIGEHYLTLSLIFYICETLEIIEEIKSEVADLKLKLQSDFEYILGIELKRDVDFFQSIKLFVSKENTATQRKINSFASDGFYENAYTFSSLAIPFFDILKKIDSLKNSHYLLMIDDAHDLNSYQIRTINSWIAFRDHSFYSFKIATTKVNRPELITATGGSILEGHDFITIDMEMQFQNSLSDFYKLSKDIIEKRLSNIGIDKPAEEFFPENPKMIRELEACKKLARIEAENKFPGGTKKQIDDYVYKYHRAIYFRKRHSKANLPQYAGFQTIVDISTGVVRNLLDPCYHMYASEMDKSPALITKIPDSVQSKIIIDRSKNMWKRIQEGLHKEIEGCTTKQSSEIYHLLDQLAILFDRRLLNHRSEPRAITFSISRRDSPHYLYVIDLLKILQKAQLLYTRLGNAKDDGKQETYYVLNRMLFPSRGLDPHGQYARVSIKSTDLYAAATLNQQIPFNENDDESNSIKQGGLFYEE